MAAVFNRPITEADHPAEMDALTVRQRLRLAVLQQTAGAFGYSDPDSAGRVWVLAGKKRMIIDYQGDPTGEEVLFEVDFRDLARHRIKPAPLAV